MKTKFNKNKELANTQWAMYFHSGTAWLKAMHTLQEESNKDKDWFWMFVNPYILYFSLELFIKSFASYEDPSFNAKSYKHEIFKIMQQYKNKIPIFDSILNKEEIVKLIKEYQKTIDTRFGETTVEIYHDETKILVDVVYLVRDELRKRTGLR